MVSDVYVCICIQSNYNMVQLTSRYLESEDYFSLLLDAVSQSISQPNGLKVMVKRIPRKAIMGLVIEKSVKLEYINELPNYQVSHYFKKKHSNWACFNILLALIVAIDDGYNCEMGSVSILHQVILMSFLYHKDNLELL